MGPYSGRMVEKEEPGWRAMKSGLQFTGLASDSREVKPGYLFAALPGSHSNGADFIADAVRRGAVAVLGRPDAAASAKALGILFIADENPRLGLARMAAQFYRLQPQIIAAVTGTNGKTSVTVFLRQIWTVLGLRAASLGTIGGVAPGREFPLQHTTPGPIEVHRLLAEMKSDGIDHLAIEASSHGLDQFRLDGARFAAAAFTNITRDHLDYHQNFDAYLATKLRLFTDVLRADGIAVVNADAEHSDAFIGAARHRKIRTITVGRAGDMRLAACTPHDGGQTLCVAFGGGTYSIELPLAGEFQAYNALVAAALAIGLGAAPDDVFMRALPILRGAPGRMEKVAYAKSGAPIYVDYAHTPDALENVLSALRPHVKGRLHVVFGCGGDRDRGKRPLMGAAAAKFADSVIVTDDNPRSEDAAIIRKSVLSGSPGAREIADRGAAIHTAVSALVTGDVLVIAGKGHESGQIIGQTVHPFSDRDEAVASAIATGGRIAEGISGALWTSADTVQATLGKAAVPFGVRGVSIDTRTLAPGDMFVALHGENRDGHDFVRSALESGASAALVSRIPDGIADDMPLLVVANTQRALEDLARAGRIRSAAKIVAVTGSAGKTTTKEMLRLAFGALGPVHASAASYNNHWGVPLSVASLPQSVRFGIFEIGMNHFGEIRTLTDIVHPHVAMITTIAPAHLEFFGNCESIADAKSEIFERLADGRAALIPADSPFADRLAARAHQHGVTRLLRFGTEANADARLLSYQEIDGVTKITADILGTRHNAVFGASGKHIAMNALGALLCVAALDEDVAAAADALSEFSALKGRGERTTIAFGDGTLELIDESYNANPASMVAAIALLGAATLGKGGRRIAVLGDMLEMGPDAARHHADLARDLIDAGVDLAFLCGTHMAALWQALPSTLGGAHAQSSADLLRTLIAALRPGDVVLVKGSFGSRMSVIVNALMRGER